MIVYGIQEQHISGEWYIHNTIYRSKKKAQIAAYNFMQAFPDVVCKVASFQLV